VPAAILLWIPGWPSAPATMKQQRGVSCSLIERFSRAIISESFRPLPPGAASQKPVSLNHTNGTKRRTGSFLDIGTGTGVLTVAASRLGYEVVIGLDTDPLALDAAKRNMEMNGISNAEIRAGTISDVHGLFDLIAANLMSEVLIQMLRISHSASSPPG